MIKPEQRRGRPKKAVEDLRVFVIKVYFTQAEMGKLKEKAGNKAFSIFLRDRALASYIVGEKPIERIKRAEIIREGVKSGLGAVIKEMKHNLSKGIKILEKIEIKVPTIEELRLWEWKGAKAEYRIYKKNKIKLKKLKPQK